MSRNLPVGRFSEDKRWQKVRFKGYVRIFIEIELPIRTQEPLRWGLSLLRPPGQNPALLIILSVAKTQGNVGFAIYSMGKKII